MSSYNIKDLANYKKDKLQNILVTLKAPKTGNKAELQKRIADILKEPTNVCKGNSCKSTHKLIKAPTGTFGSYFKAIPVHVISFFNNITCRTKNDSFSSLEELTNWMKKENVGVKMIKSVYEREKEKKMIARLVHIFGKNDLDIIRDYTCVYVSKKHNVYNEFLTFPGILYKNFTGDLRSMSSTFAKWSQDKKDALLETVINNVAFFITSLHENHTYYGDLKCLNILYDEKTEQVAVGDIGSMRYFDSPTNDPMVDKYIYTFKPPSLEGFVEAWTSDQYDFVSLLNEPGQIFSKENIKKVQQNWDNAIPDFRQDIDPNLNPKTKARLGNIMLLTYFAESNDWFAYGIAMIEFIYYLNDGSFPDHVISIVEDLFENNCANP